MTPQENPNALSQGAELPSFNDRLPDLVQVLRSIASELQQKGQAQISQSYLPYWEDLYASAHSIKGVLKILSCPPELSAFIVSFNENLLSALSGNKICRRLEEAGNCFLQISDELDKQDADKIDHPKLKTLLTDLEALYDTDLNHEDRLKEIPSHLFYVNEFVSKKAREVSLLNLSHCVVEDEVLLDEIPLWRTQLSDALTHPEFGRGIVVNFLPFLSPEGSRHLKVWAWIAAASHSRAVLKQRVKEFLPKAHIGKL